MTFTKLALAAALATTFAASANAATQTIDAGSYTFSYDDSFWAGTIVSLVGNVFTFSNLDYKAAATGTFSGGTGSFQDLGSGAVVVTAKAGNQISAIDTRSAGTIQYTVPPIGTYSGYVNFTSFVGTSWTTNNGFVIADSSGWTSGTASQPGSGQINFGSTATQNGGFVAGTTTATGDFYTEANVRAVLRGANAKLSLDTISFAVTVSAVPEPESYAMLLAGLGMMGAIARRRKAKQG